MSRRSSESITGTQRSGYLVEIFRGKPPLRPSQEPSVKGWVTAMALPFKSTLIAGRLRPIIPLLAQGMTNDEIANHLSLCKHTIEKYVSDLKICADARDRVALVLWCREVPQE